MPRAKFVVTSEQFRPSDVERITGLSVGQQREWRRLGWLPSADGGWSNFTALEVAQLLLVKTLRDQGFELANAWQAANDEVAASIVFHGAEEKPGTIVDKTQSKIMTTHPTYHIQAAFDLTGVGHAGGPFFVWGDGIEAGGYADVNDAIVFKKRQHRPVVVHFVDLVALGALLVERAGTLGTIEDAA